MLRRIERATGKTPIHRDDTWQCCCPAHDDRNPSLTVRRGHDVPFVLYCHAGCSFDDILSSIGLTMNDEWRADESRRTDPLVIEEREREQAAKREEILARRKELKEENKWLEAASLVQENPGLMQVWSDELFGEWQPITEKIVPFYSLGYVPEYMTRTSDGLVKTEALSIPYWGPRESLLTIQYKLLGPQFAKDKYRFEAGLPSTLFLTRPDKKIAGHALVVEGAKKAIVTYVQVGTHFDHVIGLPSKSPATRVVKLLNAFDRITLALDPDAHYENGHKSALERVLRLLRTEVFYMSLPSKPDDFFTVLGLDSNLFMTLAKNARRSKWQGEED